jgi:hypothetical protein
VPALSSSLIGPALEQLAGPGGSQLPPDWCPGLREYLLAVPDQRDPRGVRHSLTSVLLASVAAVLAGARSLAAIGEWVADAPPAVLAALGIRFDPLAGRFQPPAEVTIRRVLESVGAGHLDAAVTRRRAVAVDGNALRGARHPVLGQRRPGRAPAGRHQPAGPTVLAQTAVDGKTNEITRFAPLLAPLDLAGCVVTARRAAHPARPRRASGHRQESGLHPGREGQPAGPAQPAA